MIAIVDYGTGNLRSVQNMLRHLGFASQITATPDQIIRADKVILPGVGTCDYGMAELEKRDLIDVLTHKVMECRTPTLGICLGAQLLTRGSEEGTLPGFGWVEADTRRFDATQLDESLRIPHMGWADTTVRSDHPLFDGVNGMPRYYYVHAYHLVCDNPADELCHASHGYQFAAGVVHRNVMGVQFHPEKSHHFGKQILSNFAKLN